MTEQEAEKKLPQEKPPIIVEIKNNHVPDEIYRLSRENEVFYKDGITGDLIQILDCTVQAREE